jgi:4-hydroxybutyrate CoA-transferase
MTGQIPTRAGRCAGLGDWRRQYAALQMTPAAAAALVRDGDTVVMTAAANRPTAVDQALAQLLQDQKRRIELNSLFALPDTRLLAPECTPWVDYRSNFFAGERALAGQGNIHFVPTHLSQTGEWMRSRHPRVAILACSAPDEHGWMSRSLWGASLSRELLETCEVVIAEVNAELPSFSSGGEAHMLLHVSEVDAIVENSCSPAENLPAAADETDRAIAGYIADLVPDGACVQFGLGGLANAVGENLAYAGKKDLGVQTEVLSNCLVELMEKGVVNNSRKQTCPGRTVGAYFIGDRRLWAFARDNPAFSQKEIAWVNDSRNIARNERVVSINNAMEIDLTGQVNAETVGARQWSGTGGQLEWVIGSQWSNGGKSIIALRSAYRDKSGILHSKILPQLAPGSVVTTPRTWVQYVVTEYGVADLKYKSDLERARALIAIAHPDFRDELQRRQTR